MSRLISDQNLIHNGTNMKKHLLIFALNVCTISYAMDNLKKNHQPNVLDNIITKSGCLQPLQLRQRSQTCEPSDYNQPMIIYNSSNNQETLRLYKKILLSFFVQRSKL